jgi:hypothetical protein
VSCGSTSQRHRGPAGSPAPGPFRNAQQQRPRGRDSEAFRFSAALRSSSSHGDVKPAIKGGRYGDGEGHGARRAQSEMHGTAIAPPLSYRA